MAAVIRPPSTSGDSDRIFSQFGFARAFVEGGVTQRDDLALEPPFGAGPDRPFVGLDRELFHRLAGDSPLLGDQFGPAELRHLLGPVTIDPTPARRERVGEAELLRDGHRRGDRDHAHVLDATGDDEVLRAAHDSLRGEVHGLLGRAALPVDRRARHLLGETRREPTGAGDVAGLRTDRVDAAEHDVVDGRRIEVVAGDQCFQHVGAEVGRVDLAQRTPAPAHRESAPRRR